MAQQPLSLQAVFIAKNEGFCRWVDRVNGLLDRTTDEAAASLFIKRECNIKSRRQLDTEPESACAFEMLLSRYRSDRAYWGLPDDEFALMKSENGL